MNKKQQAKDRLRRWCTFGDNRAYIIMAIARRRFNEGITNSQEPIYRRILPTHEPIDRTIDELWTLMEARDLHWRLYVTANARNTLDGFINFRGTIDDWTKQLLNGNDEALPHLSNLSSEWKSELHRPASRDDEYFLFDLDDITNDELDEFLSSIKEETLLKYCQETPNGWHIITEPFNYTDWQSPVEYDDLDTDGQLFIQELDLR